jgi:hypothetical protein
MRLMLSNLLTVSPLVITGRQVGVIGGVTSALTLRMACRVMTGAS